jgi:hypothetical protein
MNAIILKGAALRQPPLPQSGPRAKTIAHPWVMVIFFGGLFNSLLIMKCLVGIHILATEREESCKNLIQKLIKK